jgi:Flp pilus assembly protein TadG
MNIQTFSARRSWRNDGSRPSAQARQRGLAAVEFALVFPIFFLIFYGLVTYSLIFVAQQSLALAASEGARSALTVGVTTTQAGTVACTRARIVASWLDNWQGTGNLGCTPAVVANCPSALASLNPVPQCIAVTVSFAYSGTGGHPLVPTIPGMGPVLPTSLSSTAVVQVGG